MMNAKWMWGWILGVGLTVMGVDAAEPTGRGLPVRGVSIAAPSVSQVERFVRWIREDLGRRGANTLILRVDFNYQYESHPELRGDNPLLAADARRIAGACREVGVRVVPQVNLLGHQSWANRVGNLLRVYPQFDETPWVTMPERYSWPNPDGLYCKSYCPLHPEVHRVVFSLVDEVCEAFGAEAFHAGLDEVFYLGEDRCPRCGGKDRSELFAGEVKRIRDHLAAKGRVLWMWGDRLLDGRETGIGEWEASFNGTQRALDLIPRDVVICDWHYERAEPTAAHFALKGFRVVSCPWKKPLVGVAQVRDMVRWREQSNAKLRERFAGVVQTVWSGVGPFLDELEKLGRDGGKDVPEESAARCYVRTFEE